MWADGYAGLNDRAKAWGGEVNGRRHSEIHAFPSGRLASERDLLGDLPSLRLQVGSAPITRKVDKLSCIRFGSARYSVPNRLIGRVVTVLVDERDRILRVIEPITGEIHAEHELVAPGETSFDDAQLQPAAASHGPTPSPQPDRRREAVPALCPVAEQFLVGAAAAGVTKLNTEITTVLDLGAAHGTDAL